MPFRRRQLTANPDTWTSGRAPSPRSAPAQKAPTPVGEPSKGVASKLTESGRASREAVGACGTERALHIPHLAPVVYGVVPLHSAHGRASALATRCGGYPACVPGPVVAILAAVCEDR